MAVDIEPEDTTTIPFDESDDADFIDQLITHFGLSTGWSVNNSQAGTGLTIERTTTPTFQINIRIVTTAIMISLDPATSITNATALTGASANISPEVEFVQDTTLAGFLIINEHTDYLSIYQLSDSRVPPILEQGVDVGVGISPAFASDPGNDFDGLMIAVGTTSMGGTSANDMYGTPSTSKTYCRTATSMWERFELKDAAGNIDIDAQDIGGRTEPIPVPLELNKLDATQGRFIGVHKYLFNLGGSARQPCQVIDDAAASKQIMTTGANAGASFRYVIGILDGFDPTA